LIVGNNEFARPDAQEVRVQCGKRIWETTIADLKLGEKVPSASIAWNGHVFVGVAGGDYKGGKGHMYALDAKTGKIVWQFFLAPRAEGPMRSADR
jgi:alcohol dehydrogenase (cytochrome c)